MTQLQGRLKGFPKTVDLDEKTMLSIARMIAYVMVGSKPLHNVSHEMSKQAIEIDARLVDEWLLKGEEHVCKKCESKR
jgi:hypothetical protein